MVQQLPCDGDGVCMLCAAKASAEEQLTCATCASPWHAKCLVAPPENLASTLHWHCPDCAAPADVVPVSAGGGSELVSAVRAIEADASLSDRQKARKRQQLLSRRGGSEDDEAAAEEEEEEECDDGGRKKKRKPHASGREHLLDGFNCAFCMQLLDRPVTTPCGHNFCLKCFQRWIGQGKNTCAKCRHTIPYKMYSQPRINSTLVAAIRMTKMSKSAVKEGPQKVNNFFYCQNRPDQAFTTERAKRNGKANAASGRIFVSIPGDHFGPITAENDPIRNQGVLVGECWADRLECRQWGAHLPHIAGICGQSKHGAQSVALSGGYEDDEDHGEWFLYTGSGGRDLSGNKRTNKEQSFDQKFDSSNESLRVSCQNGYPVRVVRSHKERRSCYAPAEGVRYDGIYRIEKCWRKAGKSGFKLCRYLFVRCDNDPAPWTSDEYGDRPRPLPAIPELKRATDITERNGIPSWDYDEEEACWKWKKPPPKSQKHILAQDPVDLKKVRAAMRRAQNEAMKQELLKDCSCLICRNLMTSPVTTPCAHNFCKACLEKAFAGQSFVRDRTKGGRSLRAQKNIMKCPSCSTDISDFLQNPQINRELMSAIESLQHKAEENEDASGDSSEDETGDANEKLDVASGSCSEHSDRDKDTDRTAGEVAVLSADCKPKRSCKRRKVETSDANEEFDVASGNSDHTGMKKEIDSTVEDAVSAAGCKPKRFTRGAKLKLPLASAQ